MAGKNDGRRVSKHWNYNPKVNITEFNKNEITKDNLVNEILLITDKDVTSSLVMNLFGSFGGHALCHHYDTFEIPVGGYKFKKGEKYVSNKEPITTTFGIWIFNVFFFRDIDLADIMGGYLNVNINKKVLEKQILGKLSYALIEDKINTEQLKVFLDRTQFIMPFETILSPSHTEKILSCTKEINKLKDKLFKENKAALEVGDESSAAVAEDIENQLKEFAMEYLKDDPSLDPYLSGAGGNIDNNFKNMYIMKGAIRNPDPTAKKEYEIAKSSFIDGISKDEYSLLARSLSGGNQQKGVIGREIESDQDFLIAVQPTRGLDVGSIEYIHKRLVEQRDLGKAVLLVSLELDEVLNVSDRIAVVNNGELIGIVNANETNENEVGLMMAGVKKEEA